MPNQLHFGSASAVAYTPHSRVLHWEGPPAEAIEDSRAATVAALAEPIDFPPLQMAVVTGDKVVLALEPNVPQAAAIIASVVEAVVQGGVSPSDITILRAEDDPQSAAQDPRAELSEASRQQVQLATHHPASRQDLSYLAADEHDHPIYMSRLLFDADVVVPIGCVRLDGPLGYGGVHATLYPTFADQAAQERCRAAATDGRDGGDGHKALAPRPTRRSTGRRERTAAQNAEVTQDEAEHVAWLLGVVFTVQVVPGPTENVLHVLAGQLEAVLRRGRQLCQEAWSFDVPQRANLVVAAIDGDAPQQTWDNVGRAVAAAQRIVSDNGVIAVCTELAEAPGPGVRTAAAAENLEQAQRRLQKQKPSDTPVAEQWAQALSRARVYLLSRLEEEQVEQLGAAYVTSADEIGRLIERTDSCVLLGSAQYVLPTAVE
ncbi:MAG: lactate racemase domain-containing protein [Pirellulales bacterium]